jgi:hypothetical protein
MGVTRTQCSFINGIVMPLVTTWVDAFPDCSGLLACLDSNVRTWKSLTEVGNVYKRPREDDEGYVGAGTPRECFKMPRAGGMARALP